MGKLPASAVFVQAAIYASALAAGYVAGLAFASSDAESMAAINACWLALYVARVANLSTAAAIPIGVSYLLAVVADLLLDLKWFYPEGGASNPMGYMLLTIVGLALVLGPLAVNAALRRVGL